MDRFDVIIIGMGVGGEAAAGRLLKAGRRVAIIERELIGGECAYWACIPSKTLLRGPEVRAEASRAAGVATPAIDWPGLRDYHDYMVRHLDDAAQVRGYEQAGATVIKARRGWLALARWKRTGNSWKPGMWLSRPGRSRCAPRSTALTGCRCGRTGRPPRSVTSPAGCC